MIIVLDPIKDTALLQNLYLLAQQTFGNALQDKQLTHEVASTVYSLYKQIEEGDADDFDGHKKKTQPERYNVWLQQSGKEELKCIKEYVILVGQIDPHFNETVRNVASGVIREINI